MPLTIETRVLPDPAGHGKALLLKGDWIVVLVSDGRHVGMGEASHSGDDKGCIQRVGELFEGHAKEIDLSPEGVQSLERGPFSHAQDFLTATAISGIDQALYDLAARRINVPVWRLFVERPVQGQVQLYLTINRALTDRTEEDYLRTVSSALEQGLRQIKCAPFEAVTPDGDQLAQAQYGLSVLRLLRSEFPELDLRIDFHKRFTYESFLRILPEIEAIAPHWIEEPCREADRNAALRARTNIPLAAGELFFGANEFVELASQDRADIVMPDVKHVGGFGPLLDVCRRMAELDVTVSPHNPSGPISTLASVHAAAVSRQVSSVETSLFSEQSRRHVAEFVDGDSFRVPDWPGWGIDVDALFGS